MYKLEFSLLVDDLTHLNFHGEFIFQPLHVFYVNNNLANIMVTGLLLLIQRIANYNSCREQEELKIVFKNRSLITIDNFQTGSENKSK